MSAPISPETSHRAGGAGGVLSHRFAGVVVAGSVNDLVVLGVRSDDEDHRAGDALLLRLRPGRADVVANVPWPARAVSALGDGRYLVVDAADSLQVVDGHTAPVLLRSGVRALRDGVVLAHDGGVFRVAVLDGAVVLLPRGCVSGGCVLGASTASTILVGASDGSVVEFDDAGHERWRAAPDDASVDGAAVDAVALVDGVVALAAGRCLQVGPRRYALKQPASSVARFHDRWYVGSTTGGLLVVDDNDDEVRSLRPSLRAHQLVVAIDGLVVVSDLFVATSTDGDDFSSRDLSALVRLAR